MNSVNRTFSSQQALWFRVAIGASFGLLIALLTKFDEPSNLTQWRGTLAGSLMLMAFVLWAGAGAMRRISLLMWAAIASAFVFYILWAAFDGNTNGRSLAFEQTLLIFPLLFIAHELVSSGDQAGKWIAPFETYFDEAWKRGVQLALAILFTLLFWGILWLGAALLGFIGFKWLGDLLKNEYFSWPVTGLAFGAAVHLGDVQTKLLANVRNLVLGVLSWLLPVITLIGAIFAGSLLASGLAPLWATKAATATLLGGCVGFVLLINAAYQQGDVERPVPAILKWCVRGAAILLLIFALLAAWSLSLRINQHGLSADRIFAGLGVIIAMAYGIGYTIAVFVLGRWMQAIEPFNIGLAIFKCALFIAVLTPIAAPDRLSVNDQVARLTSGKVKVADFDWWLLKDDTGTYGQKALAVLSKSSDATIVAKAKAALENKIGERPSLYRNERVEPVKPADIAAIPIVFPKGGKLPESFMQTRFEADNGYSLPDCLTNRQARSEDPLCKAAMIDLNGDGQVEVLIRSQAALFTLFYRDGRWNNSQEIVYLEGASVANFDAGQLRAVPAAWNDLIIGDRRSSVVQHDNELVAGAVSDETPVPPSK
jgi:Domain of unknown function (DUF4153)